MRVVVFTLAILAATATTTAAQQAFRLNDRMLALTLLGILLPSSSGGSASTRTP